VRTISEIHIGWSSIERYLSVTQNTEVGCQALGRSQAINVNDFIMPKSKGASFFRFDRTHGKGAFHRLRSMLDDPGFAYQHIGTKFGLPSIRLDAQVCNWSRITPPMKRSASKR
jgi:hypothetical protein